jgi:ABC-2 type transport system ATP-binding protein
MTNPIIEITDFRKTYAAFVAVDGISFDVKPGEIFGLLGPNGSGKTSTLECLEGLRSPNGGFLRVVGVDPAREPRKLKNLIGVQLQSAGLPDSFTPDEAMRLFCAYHKVAPRCDLLERLGLMEKRSTPFYELSTGLDVATRSELHGMLRELQTAGTTIVLATHDMAEAEQMSNRVAILLQGKIVSIGTPLEITATGAGLTKISVRTQDGCLSKSGLFFPAVTQQLFIDDYNIYFSSDIGPTISALIAQIAAHGDALIDLRVERPSLEDRFIEITKTGVAQ